MINQKVGKYIIQIKIHTSPILELQHAKDINGLCYSFLSIYQYNQNIWNLLDLFHSFNHSLAIKIIDIIQQDDIIHLVTNSYYCPIPYVSNNYDELEILNSLWQIYQLYDKQLQTFNTLDFTINNILKFQKEIKIFDLGIQKLQYQKTKSFEFWDVSFPPDETSTIDSYSWSLGVIAISLIYGTHVLQDYQNDPSLQANFKYLVDSTMCSNIVKNLLHLLLKFNVSQRIKWKDIVNFPVFNNQKRGKQIDNNIKNKYSIIKELENLKQENKIIVNSRETLKQQLNSRIANNYMQSKKISVQNDSSTFQQHIQNIKNSLTSKSNSQQKIFVHHSSMGSFQRNVIQKNDEQNQNRYKLNNSKIIERKNIFNIHKPQSLQNQSNENNINKFYQSQNLKQIQKTSDLDTKNKYIHEFGNQLNQTSSFNQPLNQKPFINRQLLRKRSLVKLETQNESNINLKGPKNYLQQQKNILRTEQQDSNPQNQTVNFPNSKTNQTLNISQFNDINLGNECSIQNQNQSVNQQTIQVNNKTYIQNNNFLLNLSNPKQDSDSEVQDLLSPQTIKNFSRKDKKKPIIKEQSNQYLIEQTKQYLVSSFKAIDLVRQTILQCIIVLRAQSNLWIIPLYIVYKRMVQMRTQLSQELINKEDNNQIPNLQNFINNNEFKAFFDQIQTENNQIDLERLKILEIARSKLKLMVADKAEKIEYLINEDLNQQLQENVFVYFYTQVYKQICNEFNQYEGSKKQELQNLKLDIQESILITEKFTQNRDSIDIENYKIQKLNDAQNLLSIQEQELEQIREKYRKIGIKI